MYDLQVRWAIWNYCLRVRGIEVEGFDYKNINSMVPVALKVRGSIATRSLPVFCIHPVTAALLQGCDVLPG